MNVIVEKNNVFRFFEDISQDRVYLPFAWLEEGVAEPPDVSIVNIFVPSNDVFCYIYIHILMQFKYNKSNLYLFRSLLKR